MALIPLSDCNPGFEPFEFNVVVLPEQLEEKIGSVFIAAQTKDVNEAAAVRGTLVAISPAAFSYHDWSEGARMPTPGDYVIFAKYGGTLIKGDDGREYRLLKDRDISAVIKPQAELLKAAA